MFQNILETITSILNLITAIISLIVIFKNKYPFSMF